MKQTIFTFCFRPTKYWFKCSFHCSSGIFCSISISQTPDVFGHLDGHVKVRCDHNDSNMYYLLWYQQTSEERELRLLGHLYSSTYNPEADFGQRVHLDGNAKSHGFMNISQLSHKDSGVYFCALREAQCLSPALVSYKNHTHTALPWGPV